jgi:dihydroneopterin aldolase
MDSIIVNNIRVKGCHGCDQSERAEAQPFRIDVTVMVDLSQAACSDCLESTVDYRALINIAKRILGGESVNLLETLAERIAEEILALQRVHEVRVRVTKLRPPVPGFDGTVSVEIERRRDIGGSSRTDGSQAPWSR